MAHRRDRQRVGWLNVCRMGARFVIGTVLLLATPHLIYAAGPAMLNAGDEVSAAWPPYLGTSFWNTPIPADAMVRDDSAELLARIPAANPAAGVLTADVTQNTYPIYVVNERTPTRSVVIEEYFSYFERFPIVPDGVRRGVGFNPTIRWVPVSAEAAAGGGVDDQILFWNPRTGAEWAFWQFRKQDGTCRATSGYVYNTRFGTGRMKGSGRGAGVSKLGGLVAAREVEVDRVVKHAIAFAYARPSPQWVFPATKSDGSGETTRDIPEGARIQLDPQLGDADFDRLGLNKQARVIARAMQTYGLILVDSSGRPKVFLESHVTGAWQQPAAMEMALAPLTTDADGRPDWSRFRVLDWDRWTGGELGLQGSK